MPEISRVALFGKLNSLCYGAIESATTLCRMRGNPYVELAHWFHQILQLPDSDLHRIAREYELDASRLAADLTASLDGLPRGASSISDLSAHIEDAVERAWIYATLLFGESQVRSGHLVIGMLSTRSLRAALSGISREFDKIKQESLSDGFATILASSPETALGAQDGSRLVGADGAAGSGAPAPAAMGRGEALERFTVDLTEKARSGEIDPIVGRDQEIRQIVDVLMRRRQNNPILTGEAGVGKTAVVEGFALRIARGDVPPPLQEVELRSLDVGLLQAGASMKGEFENRLRQLIEEVQASETPVILFIDEAHTLVGAGGAAGTGDAANLLKPALARGTLRTVAATTWAEYKKHIEKDPALTRRFQVVQIDEPDEERAIRMMRSISGVLESHHKVELMDAAIESSVRLSARYIPARQLPDKSVSLLDTACARVAVSQYAVPAEVDDSRRRIDLLELEEEIIEREESVGEDVAERKAAVEMALGEERGRLEGLEARWEREKSLVGDMLEIRRSLSAPETEAQEADRPDQIERLKALTADLVALQGESPLILPTVDDQAVASVVADWTGIPVGRMLKDEAEAVLKLSDTLNERVIGQRHALDTLAKRIQTSRAGLDNPNRPIGVFLLCGPSGVGKTETALALAEALYGGEHNVVTINMSEFQEAHTVSTLKGAPPGYVGYGEGGVLTEAVRRRPYSIVLLDEIEKAHSDVHEIFFQVFDKGMMEDGEGRLIDFKNTIILLTSNVGSELIMSMCEDPELMPDPAGLSKALRQPLLKVFPAALLGRLVVVPYYPLSDQVIALIARLQLRRIERRIAEGHGVPFSYDEAVVEQIVSRCTEVESGGRMIDAILTHTLLPALSEQFLGSMISGNKLERVHVRVEEGAFAYDFT